ncbi:MAG: hypothetical protein ACRCXN_03800 [Bacteroidales bacterium]
MKLKYLIISCVWILIIALWSCQPDEFIDRNDNPDFVNTHLEMELTDLTMGFSRSLQLNSDKDDFCGYNGQLPVESSHLRTQGRMRGLIYQFDNQGLLYHKTLPFDVDLTYGEFLNLDVLLRAGSNMSVYLFVAKDDKSLPVLQREDDWKRLSYEYSGIHYSDNLPFYNSQTGVSIESSNKHTLQRFKLRRICNKLIFDFNVKESSGFIAEELRLVNVPKRSNYDPDYKASNADYQDLSIPLDAQSGLITVFLPENLGGTVSNIQQAEQKNIQNAPKHATYIELRGRYLNKHVVFRIYPGSNETSDFNIERNHWYRLGINIRDVYLDDSRVESVGDNEFVIHLVDGDTNLWQKVRNVRLNNYVWLSDVTLKNNSLHLNYTSSPGSFLNYLEFYDANNILLFKGEVGYTFKGYDSMYFSREMGAQGNGSSKDPYLLFNLQQLKNMHSFYEQIYEGRNYKQMNDFDVSGFRYWQPIGDNTTPFRGVYDGNGYKISNMHLNSEWNKEYYFAGFFGFTYDCTLKNIHIRNSSVKCKSDWMGGIVAYGRNTRIEECSVDVHIEQHKPAVAGGIAGELENSVIYNCYNINKNGYTAWNAITHYTGGIVGRLTGSDLANVYSIAPIHINMDGVSSGIGAIVGKVDEASRVHVFYGLQSQNNFNTSIGIPHSKEGISSEGYLKSQDLVDKLNNGTTGSKWIYNPYSYPSLSNERK